jgi:DNA-binding transcriptional MerR regulator
MPASLTELQIRQLEASHPEGMTSQELIAAFEEHQVQFSEATLRKYVQLGLVPRSRRVGRKGKHLGSRGVYPVRAVRRINTIKRLMAERYTIEEIRAKFLTFKDSIETLDESVGDLLRIFEERIDATAMTSASQRDRLRDELRSLRGTANKLLEGVHRLEKMIISAGEGIRPRGGGAASPTELL